MYCPNCKQSFEGKFCPECGTKLIEEPQISGINVNFGDANAISGGVHINVERNKSDKELKLEASNEFLTICREVFEDLVLSPDELMLLENKRLELGLDKQQASEILESVRQLASRAKYTAPLSGISKIKLKQFSNAILKNDMDTIIKLFDSIESMAKSNANEELQFKYYLVLSTLYPEKCIETYEHMVEDNYWLMFWTYLAYIRTGNLSKSEKLLLSLSNMFDNYPEANTSLLASAGILIQEGVEAVQEYLSVVTDMYSPLLQRFYEALFFVSGSSKYASDSLSYYVQKVLCVLDKTEKEMQKFLNDERFTFSDDGTTLISCDDEDIKSYKIPDFVVSIGEDAFRNCKKLKEIALPTSLKTIGCYAFQGCALRTVVIPEGVTEIGDCAFRGCRLLDTFIMPEGVKHIGNSAFYGCNSLREIELPSSLASIGNHAFQDCGLTSVIIHEGITRFGIGTFEKCVSLKNIKLPTTLSEISYCVFQRCGLESIVIPESVLHIAYRAFADCTKLADVKILSTWTKIDENAFVNTPYKGADK